MPFLRHEPERQELHQCFSNLAQPLPVVGDDGRRRKGNVNLPRRQAEARTSRMDRCEVTHVLPYACWRDVQDGTEPNGDGTTRRLDLGPRESHGHHQFHHALDSPAPTAPRRHWRTRSWFARSCLRSRAIAYARWPIACVTR